VRVVILLCAVAFAVPLAAADASRDTRWKSAKGLWTESEKWSGGVPDTSSRVAILGESEVHVEKMPQPAGVGTLALGKQTGDKVRLLIDGGELVSRRDYVHAGEADGGKVEIVLNDGALHDVSAFYLGGSGEKRVGACHATLRIRGGSFVCRLLTVGLGQRSEAKVSIEGSRATAVHTLDGVWMGVPIAGREPGTSTLAFTLDERGVTPITIQARRTGLHIYRVATGSRCRLQVSLSAVPPRDDVTLVSARASTIGTFDDLSEGAEVHAEYAGRTYAWTLTYRGGASGCDIALTKVRGHAPDAPVTACRDIPPVPVPLWDTMPAHPAEAEEKNLPSAFDGAEGFGRIAAGGRGGRTLWVENLNDFGPGSFREAALARGPRIIQFHVAGDIALKSPLSIIEPFLTVNGDSAPAGGVTFTGSGITVQTHDVILRHFRIRPGDDTDDMDALDFYDAQRCIADHLSLGWGTDEVLSITGLSDAITVQWCLIHEALNREKHAFASIAAGERVTWHHNLFAHHVSRVPRFAGIVSADFRNNVLYNWGHTAGYGQFERVNYVGNYLKPGPSTTQKPPLIHRGDETVGRASLYLDGNILEGSEAVTRDNWLGVGFEREARATEPFAAPSVQTTDATTAYEAVLSQAGALPDQRDATDTRVVREVRTGTGRIINHTSDVAGAAIDPPRKSAPAASPRKSP
jgi:pectate lyase